MFFFQLTMLSNIIALMAYLSGVYLESWFSWLWGGVQKTLKKRKKQTEEKHWKVKRKKNEAFKESQITIHIFGFKLYFARKHNLRKSSLYHQILLQFLCIARYLNHSNDTPNLNIHKYTYYNTIDLYINRLSTTM